MGSMAQAQQWRLARALWGFGLFGRGLALMIVFPLKEELAKLMIHPSIYLSRACLPAALPPRWVRLGSVHASALFAGNDSMGGARMQAAIVPSSEDRIPCLSYSLALSLPRHLGAHGTARLASMHAMHFVFTVVVVEESRRSRWRTARITPAGHHHRCCRRRPVIHWAERRGQGRIRVGDTWEVEPARQEEGRRRGCELCCRGFPEQGAGSRGTRTHHTNRVLSPAIITGTTTMPWLGFRVIV
ncbi:hypothetical protein GUJ93_ZPchr0002g23365 [Zizania palustris]|uniref:Uncharacterized protein n=1 Tax=Zizania palustris TaxID=103762 RepID=A0A8J5RV65_ZIZPA|nr:hypothetical protein GUJ93_ZPchr0002g23365 [Zizania palustris]